MSQIDSQSTPWGDWPDQDDVGYAADSSGAPPPPSFFHSSSDSAMTTVIASTPIAAPVNHSAFVHSVSHSAPSAPRVCNPRCFNGKIEVKPFLNRIKDCLFLQRNALSTDEDKCSYTGLYLADGSPVEWFTKVKRNNPVLLQNFTQFILEFRSKFSDPPIHRV
ncbi:hypothetical protein B0H17DRAFT_1213405 [Mycena rosella]|uniref:Retrotransposon gag domain-containing protein n=1 Tax=Mycena rosella TaxID=1033263 RepID=A0AAD7CQ63_MYCRO|nr:hypothetical protein B0H17DRAFT_1213405 [Mycena rosella]